MGDVGLHGRPLCDGTRRRSYRTTVHARRHLFTTAWTAFCAFLPSVRDRPCGQRFMPCRSYTSLPSRTIDLSTKAPLSSTHIATPTRSTSRTDGTLFLRPPDPPPPPPLPSAVDFVAWRREWQVALDKKDVSQLTMLWRTHRDQLDQLHVGQLACYIALLRMRQKSPAIRHAALFRGALSELFSWCREGSPAALALCRHPTVLADLVSLCARSKEPSVAFELLRLADMSTSDRAHLYHHPTIVDSLVRLCWHTQEHVLGLAILRDHIEYLSAHREAPPLSDTCWGFLLSVLIARKQLETVRQLERHVFTHCASRLTNGFFSWLMHAYARKGNARDTARVFQKANETLGASLDIGCLNALLRAFAIGGDTYRMDQVWKVIHARRLVPNLASFTILLHGYLLSEQPRMLDVLERELALVLQRQGDKSAATFGTTDHIWLHNRWRALVDAEEWEKALALFQRHWACDAPQPMQFNWCIYSSCLQLLKSVHLSGDDPVIQSLYQVIRARVEDAAKGDLAFPPPHKRTTKSASLSAHKKLPKQWHMYNTHHNVQWFVDWGVKQGRLMD